VGPINYQDLIEKDLFVRMINGGYIKVQDHPTEELRIYNYTQKATIERVWNAATRQCRGLILHFDGSVAARPFPKFFNLAEHPRSDIVFSKPYKVSEKMDGSLGICYLTSDGPQIATRGSFVSDQAIRATKILRDKYPKFHPSADYTFLFEIIYPENRIVVDYQGMEDLVLLAAIRIDSGVEFDISDHSHRNTIYDVFGWPGPWVKHWNIGEDLHPREVGDKLGINDGSQEGFVLAFDWPKGSVTRVKVKMEEYVRLHKIMTGISTKAVWEALKEGDDIHEMLWQQCPTEVYEWAIDLVTELTDEFRKRKEAIFADYESIIKQMKLAGWDCTPSGRKNNPAWRGEFARLAKMSPQPNMVFAVLDGRNVNPAIWDDIRPPFARPFDDDEPSATPIPELYIG
jgi:RNA ligase